MIDESINKNKIKFPLKFKLILTQVVAMFFVVVLILFTATRMTYQDKESYLYDTAYSNVQFNKLVLESYFNDKERYSNSLVDTLIANDLALPRDRLEAAGSDLFEVLRLEARNAAIERSIYLNDKELIKYSDNIEYISSVRKHIDSIMPELIAKKKISRLFIKEETIPHYIFARYDEKSSKVYYFVYFVHKFFERYFSSRGLENAVINMSGEYLFRSNPHNSIEGESNLILSAFNEEKSGFKEINIHEDDLMVGYEKTDLFGGLYIVSMIKTKKAFEVTKVLIAKTFFFTLVLIGAFNIISLIISDSITKPLRLLVKGIDKVSQGNYDYQIDVKTRDELKVVANSFNQMGGKIQEYYRKLEEYNRTLEQRVDERTTELKNASDFIRAMIDSLNQGLIVVGKDGLCGSIFTVECENIYGVKPVGMMAAEVLKQENKDVFNRWIQSLFEEMLPFENLVELGPSEIIENENENEVKHISLGYSCMRDDQGKVSNVIIIGSDDTREFLAKKKLKEQEELVKIVVAVLGNKNNFISFFDLFTSELKTYVDDISIIKNVAREDLLRFLHSLKGSAALYKLSSYAQFVHEVESILIDRDISYKKIHNLFSELLDKLLANQAMIEKTIGGVKSDNVTFVTEESVSEYLKYLEAIGDHELINKYKTIFFGKKIESYLEPYKNFISEASKHLGKEVEPLKIVGGDLVVKEGHLDSFFNSCIHLFRNSLDHGIEAPDKRALIGKQRAGKLRAYFTKIDENRLLFELVDDGGGIDPNRVRKKMKSLSYDARQLEKDDAKIIYHIFDPEFSTADEVTDLSGRGVGLYDIREIVEEIGGKVTIETKVGMGTKFSFELPLKTI